MDCISIIHSQDAQLLQGIAEGCHHSFKTLYDKYWEVAYSAAYKRLKNSDQAKDIVQEIFTHIWVKRTTLHIDNLPAYLHVAVRNRVLKQLAKEKVTHPFFDLLERFPSLGQQTDTSILTKEFLKAYEALVNSLPTKKQLIYRLRYEEDQSTKDIAEQLGISRKTVQNQLTNAVEFLRAALFFLLLLIIFFL